MALAAVVLVGLVVSLLAGSVPAGVRGSGPVGFDLEQARAFREFPLYDGGGQVDGLPLVAVLRRDDSANFVSFVYGDCVARDDEGCAPPVEVQVWPACRRHLGLYDSSLPGTPAPERTQVRGVPGAFFEDGQRLELQTGPSTVVVFASSRDRVLRVASALRRVGGRTSGGALPAPEPGALVGDPRC